MAGTLPLDGRTLDMAGDAIRDIASAVGKSGPPDLNALFEASIAPGLEFSAASQGAICRPQRRSVWVFKTYF
jgi:hypothetical protein